MRATSSRSGRRTGSTAAGSSNWNVPIGRPTSRRERQVPRRPGFDALQEAETAIGAWTKAQSDLLKPPYYNGSDADFAAFEADKLTGPEILAAEQRTVEA